MSGSKTNSLRSRKPASSDVRATATPLRPAVVELVGVRRILGEVGKGKSAWPERVVRHRRSVERRSAGRFPLRLVLWTEELRLTRLDAQPTRSIGSDPNLPSVWRQYGEPQSSGGGGGHVIWIGGVVEHAS